jgi:hypothetical protein
MPLLNLQAQDQTDEIHLFNNYLRDVPISENAYVEPMFMYMGYEGASGYTFSAFLGFPIREKMEIQLWIPYMKVSYKSRSESGLIDPVIIGRYLISQNDNTKYSLGAGLDVPIGSEDMGQGMGPDFTLFGALRHRLQSGLVLCANGGVGFDMNYKDEYESGLNLGGGFIYPSDESLSFIGEIIIPDVTIFGGIDYRTGSGHIRSGVALPLEEDAPDFSFWLSYFIYL